MTIKGFPLKPKRIKGEIIPKKARYAKNNCDIFSNKSPTKPELMAMLKQAVENTK